MPDYIGDDELANRAVLGVEGSLITHPWIRDGLPDQDPYSVFIAESIANGWTSLDNRRESPGLWASNDASSLNTLRNETEGMIGWFQAQPYSRHISHWLPALSHAAVTALGRFGELQLRALDVLLSFGPLQGQQDVSRCLSMLNLFGLSRPSSAAVMTLEISWPDGEVMDVHAASQRLRKIRTGPFVFQEALELPSVSPSASPALQFSEPRDSRAARLSVVSPEWSHSAAAWAISAVVSCLPEVARRTELRCRIELGADPPAEPVER